MLLYIPSPAVNGFYVGPAFIHVYGLMYVVGIVEIVAGIIVALRPRIGGYVVAAWLAGIIVNLLILGTYYDIALRDFGLLLGALTLARLAIPFDRPLGSVRSAA